MALHLGGNYKTYFIGGPKNGRSVIIDNLYPTTHVYVTYKFPRLRLWDTGPDKYDVFQGDMNTRQIEYLPRVFRLVKNGEAKEYIFMVYSNSKNVDKNATLLKLIDSGRLKPNRVYNV